MPVPRPRRIAGYATAAAAVVAVVAAGISNATAASSVVPIGQTMTGTATYYNDAGYGACGTAINAATQMLVAVSYQWWTTANPNNDPICQGIFVEVTYHATTITVPVRDKCPSCDAAHIDLSQAAFAQFASTDPADTPGVLDVTWRFVNATGGAGATSASGSGDRSASGSGDRSASGSGTAPPAPSSPAARRTASRYPGADRPCRRRDCGH